MESKNIERSFRSEKVCPLSRFSSRLLGTVVDITTGAELQGRLMGMGLFAGTRFRLLRGGTATSSLPLLLAIGETRIAIDREIADKILVEP
jgi:Fe2+ transport system protein FeoA